MKKSKLLVAALTLSIVLGGLVGCSSKGSDKATSGQSKATSTATKEAKDNSDKDLLTQIKERGTLLIGTEGTYAPYTYHDETGELVGYDVEVAKAIAEKLGVKAEFVESNWDSLIAGLDAIRYDVVINQVTITDERLEKYDFSTPYTISRAALIVGKDNKDIKTFEDLKGKKSAQGLTSNYATLAEKYGAELVSADGSFSKSIELVSTGRAEATINDQVSFYDFLKQKPDASVKLVDTLDDASKNAVLIRKGNETFVEAINKALDELSQDGTLSKISKKYFGEDVTK
ncbi:amino acid ABC transporter substrate-binding protein [Anaeromicropila herbilytica]|uniref:Amino acid ABC transporter substrate-binding protein n=1 Tax=Anaeromicropila herbilytica TaxID=2785025 RepID=A0A7R7EMK6_9FIRM|nr:amino acid ABC transporter substrate-binding protein [Anaeromicropila herbilytica]BCN31635.1 amino acid ABC transporter substrate-binding protein [Anaeromicropila herbilytica]